MLQDCFNLTKLSALAVGCRLPNDSFFDEGNSHITHIKKYGIYETDLEDLLHEPIALFCCELLGCNKRFDTVFQFEQHYNSNHRYSCGTCKKSMTSPHLLDLHICETHDSYFAVQSEKKPMFRCYLEECPNIFLTPKIRKQHCIEVHSFPSAFFNNKAEKTDVNSISNSKIKKSAIKNNKDLKKMEVDLSAISPVENQLGDKLKKTKEPYRNRAKTQNLISNAPLEKMEVADKQTKAENKSLGSGNRHNRRRIFVSFERDMADSLPILEPKKTK